MVKVGSARIAENGSVNGVKGDQTGREIATENLYNHAYGWRVLRAKNENVANILARAMVDACLNNNCGYGQNDRLSGYNATVKYKSIAGIKEAVNFDCSSLVRACLYMADIKTANFTTWNEASVILGTGEFTEVIYNENNLCNGDILVTKKQGHTVIVTSGATERGTTSKSADVEYKVKINTGWLPAVINNNDYAGLENRSIFAFALRRTDGGAIRYRAHLNGRGWLEWVDGYDVNDYYNGYAGDDKTPIDAIEIKCDECDYLYKVSTMASSSYLPEVSDNTLSGGDSYAGIFGKSIDKIMIRKA